MTASIYVLKQNLQPLITHVVTLIRSFYYFKFLSQNVKKLKSRKLFFSAISVRSRFSPIVTYQQSDQKSQSWKVINKNAYYKNRPNILGILGHFWEHHYLIKNCSGHILGNLVGKIGDFLFRHLVSLLIKSTAKRERIHCRFWSQLFPSQKNEKELMNYWLLLRNYIKIRTKLWATKARLPCSLL